MTKIKEILDEIASVSGKLDKVNVLTKFKDNELLKKVIYKAHSPRVKFFIKQIPAYETDPNFDHISLENAIDMLDKLSNREFTGNRATEWLHSILSSLTADDAIIIERIIGKDLKIGMDSSINKVIPKLIEETPYQGAVSFSEKGALKLFEEKSRTLNGIKHTIVSQIKADGTYRNAIISNGEVELLSRQGEVSNLKGAKFLEELTKFDDCVLNGELTIDGIENRAIANGIVTSIMDITQKAVERGEKETEKKIKAFTEKHGDINEMINRLRFTVWDMITVDEYLAASSDRAYISRFFLLESIINTKEFTNIDLIETRFVDSYEEAMEHFLDAQKRELEGTIIKSSIAGWKDGKPTYQIKMKLEMDMDLRIIGFKYGKKGTKNEEVISVLELESECGLLKTAPAGMTEAMMADITERQEELLGTVVQIRCCGLSQTDKGWSTSHPSIVELRPDKNTCDTLETCIQIQEMAKTLSAK
jgi:ATP-dependent DNA ligase